LKSLFLRPVTGRHGRHLRARTVGRMSEGSEYRMFIQGFGERGKLCRRIGMIGGMGQDVRNRGSSGNGRSGQAGLSMAPNGLVRAVASCPLLADVRTWLERATKSELDPCSPRSEPNGEPKRARVIPPLSRSSPHSKVVPSLPKRPASTDFGNCQSERSLLAMYRRIPHAYLHLSDQLHAEGR
jgi:hypothetical protein